MALISANKSVKLMYAAVFALPVVLVFSSLRTFAELDAQREVYLRERAASLAGLLEAASTQAASLDEALSSLGEGESHLIQAAVAPRPSVGDGNPDLDDVWSGRALFRTRFVELNGIRVYRAYVPFHAAGQMNVAQIDLAASASDFLVVHARHNVIISVLGGVVLVAISLYALWAARRTAALERSHLEMQHLAQLGTMSAVLAHEIRNPLGTIKGFAQLAMEQSTGGVRALLSPVLDQTQRLEALVNDLLVYGRPPSPSLRTVHWHEIANRLESFGNPLAAEKRVEYEVRQSAVDIETDPDLLEHILVNLVRNAIDAVAGETGGAVQVSALPNRETVVITVQDNGPGIPDGDREKVREAFYTTKAFGTGLGLPISLRLAKVLQGNLELEPAPGHGTIARVRIPARSQHGTDTHRR